MFRLLGQITSRRAPIVLVVWLLVLLGSLVVAPDWLQVVQNGEFAFLPEDAPSRVAEEEFRKAFPEQSLASNVVLVLRREASTDGLSDADRVFMAEVLLPRLREIAGFAEGTNRLDDAENEGVDSLVSRLRWSGGNPHIGDMFNSSDGRGSLIVMELRSEFLDQGNEELIVEVEDFLEDLRQRPDSDEMKIPQGLDITFSGTATFGRDMIRASLDSARSTEKWTVILVVVLLLLIYRSPLLAMIPLLTVAVATAVTLSLLAIGANLGWVRLFNGIETYVTVLVYGAGVDYCLFLIARYREELDLGASTEDAIARTMRRIGPALAASAGTSMCGIGMMTFADFGKFQQAGFAITFGFAICLISALTLTPAVLRLMGRWAFWPSVSGQSVAKPWGLTPSADIITRLLRSNFLQTGWKKISRRLVREPGRMWFGSVLGLMPFSIIGLMFFGFLSYGLLSELPETAASVQGANALQSHFAAGEMAPIDVVLKVPQADFQQKKGDDIDALEEFTDAIVEQNSELGLHAVRSISSPKGQVPLLPNNGEGMSPLDRVRVINGINTVARTLYVSKEDPAVARIELIFKQDPFSRSSIAEFHRLKDLLPTLLPDHFKDAQIYLKGETANISDLKDVTDSDQIRIDILVLIGVFVVLILLLRKPGICTYLMGSVFFSYLAALGFTFCVFWLMDPNGFSGLDWKVPMFLFTILIAVGVDYNIFLMTRIEEEQKAHGPVQGITVALEKTGSIISSCGIIMAGTFSSLLAGSLVGMDQLGLALAVGVLLDTFVVRPVLLPSFLILLAQGKLGVLSRMAGYTLQNGENPTPVSDDSVTEH